MPPSRNLFARINMLGILAAFAMSAASMEQYRGLRDQYYDCVIL